VVAVERKDGDLYIYDEKEYCSECLGIGTGPELQ